MVLRRKPDLLLVGEKRYQCWTYCEESEVNTCYLYLRALADVFRRGVLAEYGRTPESSFDPSVVKIDEGKYLGAKLDGSDRASRLEGEEF